MNKKDLASGLALHMVEAMDMEILLAYAMDALRRDYAHYTEEQLIAEAKEYAPHLLEPEDAQDKEVQP